MAKKPKKLRRRGHSVFRANRKRTVKRVVLVLLAVALIPAGFFVAKYIMEDMKPGLENSSSPSTVSSTSPAVTESTKPTESTTVPVVAQKDMIKAAFYIDFETLKDENKLGDILEKAKASKTTSFNAVVFDLKDESGDILYKTATQLASQTESVAENAMEVSDLKNRITLIKEKGFFPVPRIYAFKDHIAPFGLPSAKITLQDDVGMTWIDNSLSAGGKPWLNPYSPDAHKFISDLGKEIESFGVSVIMLDGVQFPYKTYRAYYGGDELTNLSQIDVLRKFETDFKAGMNADTTVIMSFPAEVLFSEKAAAFGGDVISIGGDIVAPSMLISDWGDGAEIDGIYFDNAKEKSAEIVKILTEKVELRISILEGEKPRNMPFVEVTGFDKDAVLAQIAAIRSLYGEKAIYILYDKNAEYDFEMY